MLVRLATALGLLAACVALHAGALTIGFRRIDRFDRNAVTPAWLQTWRLIRIASWLVLIHLVEIAVWAVFYTRVGGFADIESSFYFSAVTYTTTGYGDLVLKGDWRLFAGVEGLTGILMCGWSTGFFFAVFSKMYRRDDVKPTN